MRQEEEVPPTGCCGSSRIRKVTPYSNSPSHLHAFEIRPGRRLVIHQRNHRPREEDCQQQYDEYLTCIQQNNKNILQNKKPKQQQVTQQVTQHVTKQVTKQVTKDPNSHSYSNYGLSLDDESTPEKKIANNGLSHNNGIHGSQSHSEWMLNFRNSPKRYLTHTTSSPSHVPGQAPGTFPSILDSPTKSHGITREPTQVPVTQLISEHVHVNTLKHVSLEMYQSSEEHTDELLDLERSPKGHSLSKAQSPPSLLESREDSFSSNRIQPDPDQGCVFLIHGVGGSASVWKAQDEYLTSRNYEVIIPDLIGHGSSPAPMDRSAYEFEEIAADVLAVFDRFCKKRNVIIGHSYGCSFAVKLCRQRARWINKLVMVSGGSPSPLAPQPGIFSMPLCFLCCCQNVLSRGFKKSAFHSKKSYIPQNEAFDIPPHVLKFTMNGQNWPEGGVEYHMSLNIPTLIIHGEDDKFVALDEEQEMRQVVHGSELILVKNASHMVMLEQPEVVNELIEKFMQKSAPLPGSTTQHLVQEGIDLIEHHRQLTQQHMNQQNMTPQQQSPEVSSPQRLISPRRTLSGKFRRSSRPAISTLNGSQLSLRSVKTIPANLVTANLP